MLKELTRKKVAEIKSETVTITPSVAQAWLSMNANNRKRQPRFVRQYARDMKDGGWRLTGDSIKFDVNNRLIDGQHRLAACVEADRPFQSLVIYNLPVGTQDVIDTGKSRSSQDVLAIHGVQNATSIASAIKLLVNEKRGISNVGGQATITHSELLAALDRHPNIVQYVSPIRTFPRGISTPTVGYIRYVASTFLNKYERANAMVTVLKSGIPDYEGDPIHAFRERILRTYAESIGGVQQRQATWWTLKYCWNLFAAGKTVTALRWRTDDVPIIGLNLKDL